MPTPLRSLPALVCAAGAAGAVPALAAPAVAAAGPVPAPAGAARCVGGLLLVREHALLRLPDPFGPPRAAVPLTRRLNALGHAAGPQRTYAVAAPDEVVTLDAAGTLRPVGPLPAQAHGATAGAVHGDQWYLGVEGRLVVVDLRAGSPTYLHAVADLPTNPWTVLRDFAYRPADGELWGVAARGYGHPSVLARLDPRTAQVRTFPTRAALPAARGFGAVALGPDDVLHALDDDTGHLLHVPLRGGPVTRTALGGRSRWSDATACPPAPAAAVPPPRPVRPPAARAPHPRPAGPPARAARGRPAAPPPRPRPAAAPPPRPPAAAPAAVRRHRTAYLRRAAARRVPESRTLPASLALFVGAAVPAVVAAARIAGRLRGR
ncbi:hypothetical protein GCM10010124_28880 [Pilimelia terevasa]|uniref:DUF6923 domain-containing protein n=1 Tax=Pilimelia terevasa TaxID=53372 RepID=A0A8J3FKQ8_9ACTN|nr:hypothetical protein [Pilimelia terevasa]GGK34487.1 hypothetical protein GCM10010124_28880 [Pilimelia terevasa]